MLTPAVTVDPEGGRLLGNRGELGYVWVRRTRTAHVIALDSGRTVNSIRTGRRVPFLLSP